MIVDQASLAAGARSRSIRIIPGSDLGGRAPDIVVSHGPLNGLQALVDIPSHRLLKVTCSRLSLALQIFDAPASICMHVQA